MTQEEYINERLEHQIEWYDNKSTKCQKKHKFWQVMKIVAALLITSLSLWAPAEITNQNAAFHVNLSHLIGVMGAFVVFIESFVKIFDYEKLWVQYRNTAEKLNREKVLFQTRSKPYHTKEAFTLLVQQCEAIMQDEVMGWTEPFTGNENGQ